MGRADFLQLGDWNTVCWQCGFKAKASTLVRNWQGYYVHPEHNEPRQTQDFVRGVADNQIAPWVQPAPAAIYTYTNIQLGQGDGVNKFFQLGCGLYAVTVTQVEVGGVPTGAFTDNGTGGITLTTAPAPYIIVTASGKETMA
jgi:hypothetical protein